MPDNDNARIKELLCQIDKQYAEIKALNDKLSSVYIALADTTFKYAQLQGKVEAYEKVLLSKGAGK